MYFERLVVDRKLARVLEGRVAEEGLWSGGRLLASKLGKDDHAWVGEVLERLLEEAGGAREGDTLRLEGALEGEAVRYRLFVDDGEGRPLGAAPAELDEVLSALSGLVEID